MIGAGMNGGEVPATGRAEPLGCEAPKSGPAFDGAAQNRKVSLWLLLNRTCDCGLCSGTCLTAIDGTGSIRSRKRAHTARDHIGSVKSLDSVSYRRTCKP
jgi:hypothetical protein